MEKKWRKIINKTVKQADIFVVVSVGVPIDFVNIHMVLFVSIYLKGKIQRKLKEPRYMCLAVNSASRNSKKKKKNKTII